MASLDATVGAFLRAVNVGLPPNEHKGAEFVEGLEKFLLEKCEAILALLVLIHLTGITLFDRAGFLP